MCVRWGSSDIFKKVFWSFFTYSLWSPMFINSKNAPDYFNVLSLTNCALEYPSSSSAIVHMPSNTNESWSI